MTLPFPTSRVGMDVIAALFLPLGQARVEMAAVAYLDRAHRLLAMRHVAGERDWLALSIRTVAADALAFGAHAAMLAHNHPSGDPTPSASDYAFTRRLARGLDALGVTLLDHLVVGAGSHTSLRAAGYL